MSREPATPMPPICILAGGLGSRLGQLVQDVPKPIVEVAGRPFLEHQLRLLAAGGIRRAVICVGYMGELIEQAIGSQSCGIEVAYTYDGPELAGTLGAIRGALGLLGERFLVIYGDTYLRLDYPAAVAAWAASGCPAMMTVLRNENRWDTSNAVLSGGLVTRYEKGSPTAATAWIDYGLGGLQPSALELVPAGEPDLTTLYGELARRKQLCGVQVSERFYEIGTPAALAETEAFLRGQGGRGREACGDGPSDARGASAGEARGA